MSKNNLLRNYVKQRRLRKTLYNIYSQRKILDENSSPLQVPLGRHHEISLYLSRRGFQVLNLEKLNTIYYIHHLPFTKRYYQVTFEEPTKNFSIRFPRIKELCNLVPELDPEKIIINFNNRTENYRNK